MLIESPSIAFNWYRNPGTRAREVPYILQEALSNGGIPSICCRTAPALDTAISARARSAYGPIFPDLVPDISSRQFRIHDWGFVLRRVSAWAYDSSFAE